MRLLFAVHGYPPDESGGAERRAERTARALVDRGHDVAVLVASSGRAGDVPATSRHQDGVDVWRVQPGRHRVDRPTTLPLTYDDPQVSAIAARLLDEFEPDILHVIGGYRVSAGPVRLARQHRVRTVVSLTDYWWVCHRITLMTTLGSPCEGPTPVGCARCLAEWSRRYRWLARASPTAAKWFWHIGSRWPGLAARLGIEAQRERREALARVLADVDAIVAPSKYVLHKHRTFDVGQDALTYMRQGVELDACPRRVPSHEVRFGYLGQIKPHKGVDLLLEAWRRLRGSQPRRLTLWGSAAGEAAYGESIQRSMAGTRDADWAGELDAGGVWDVLSHLDVVVIASRWPENSPNVILEAQAVGVPVVASRVGGIPELVEHERNGLLFEAGSVSDLACQMQRFVDDSALRARLARAPLPFRSLQQEIGDLEALYADVLAKPR